MKPTLPLVLLSLFVFSSCQASPDAGRQIIDQVRRQTSPAASPSPLPIPTDSSQSDQDLLNEINQLSEPDIDSDLSDLEDQLK